MKPFECRAYPGRYNRSLDERFVSKEFFEELRHLLKLRECEAGIKAPADFSVS